jgi:hypothetical protein
MTKIYYFEKILIKNHDKNQSEYIDKSALYVKNQIQKHTKINPFDFIPLSFTEPIFKELRFNIEEESAIMLWGDGCFHQVSAFFGPNKPYIKVVFDAHDDINFNYNNNEIDCGNHNAWLLENDPNVKEIMILGTNALKNKRVEEINNKKAILKNDLEAKYRGETLHISVDLDVVRRYPARDCWKDGTKTFNEVRKSIEELLANNQVSRFDMGGLGERVVYESVRASSFFKNKKYLTINDPGVNEYFQLLKMFLDYQKNH